MSSPIITAVRQIRQFKEPVFHTLIELAHRSSIYGVARVSYGCMAKQCHCCRQTIINHIKQLISAGILKKSVIWIKGNFCEVNTYTFQIAWDKRPVGQGSQNSLPKFPRQEEGEKFGSLAEKKRLDARGLTFLTPGSALHRLVAERQT
jgi:hypothetical protein